MFRELPWMQIKELNEPMNRNEQLAMTDNKANSPVIEKLKNRLINKIHQGEKIKIEINQLRELIKELEK